MILKQINVTIIPIVKATCCGISGVVVTGGAGAVFCGIKQSKLPD